MSDELPYPVPRPGSYDPSGPFRNPGRTVPGPPGWDIPVPSWSGGITPVIWNAVPGGNPYFTHTWIMSSPIFDLRPDLRIGQNRTGSQLPGNDFGAQPFNGPNPQFWIQIMGGMGAGAAATPVVDIRSEDLRGLQFLTWEEGSIWDIKNIRSITNPYINATGIGGEDTTQQFNTLGAASVMRFVPPGDNYPMRYWRFSMVLGIRANMGNATLPRLAVASAMY